MKVCVFLDKVSESPREAPEGLERPREGLSTIFRAWESMHEKNEKVHKECFAQHVDGAPSTAPSFKLDSRDARDSKLSRLFSDEVSDGAKHSFRELFRIGKSTARRKVRSRPFNDSSCRRQ